MEQVISIKQTQNNFLSINDGKKISPKTKALLEDTDNELYFSLVSIWELTIKSSLNKLDFPVDIEKVRLGLLKNGLKEITVNVKQILEIKQLPHIHKDPLDRLLIAQAKIENFHFLTVDEKIILYPFDFIINAN